MKSLLTFNKIILFLCYFAPLFYLSMCKKADAEVTATVDSDSTVVETVSNIPITDTTSSFISAPSSIGDTTKSEQDKKTDGPITVIIESIHQKLLFPVENKISSYGISYLWISSFSTEELNRFIDFLLFLFPISFLLSLIIVLTPSIKFKYQIIVISFSLSCYLLELILINRWDDLLWGAWAILFFHLTEIGILYKLNSSSQTT